MDDKITQLSIKQRLKSAKIVNDIPPYTSLSTSENKIYAPEQYNYFSHIIDKEIKQEGCILNRIKKQIEDFKLKRKSKVKIKNSYEYEHKSFVPSLLNKNRISQKKTMDFQSMNISRGNSKNKSSNKLIQSNVTHFYEKQNKSQETNTQAPCFKRSEVSTPLGYFQQPKKQIQRQMNSTITNNQNRDKKLMQSKRFNKNSQLSIAGSHPNWKNFESYYRNHARYTYSSLQ